MIERDRTPAVPMITDVPCTWIERKNEQMLSVRLLREDCRCTVCYKRDITNLITSGMGKILPPNQRRKRVGPSPGLYACRLLSNNQNRFHTVLPVHHSLDRRGQSGRRS